jgi:hypothetical protein
MHIGKKTSFYYHADATALGGTLKYPYEHIVSTNAAVSLAQAGGFGSSRADKYHVDGLISLETGHVHVSGTEHKEHGGYRTIATARVEHLNILDVVTADRITGQVSLFHPYDHGPIQVSLLGSHFVNLKVNGFLVSPKLDRRMFGAGREGAHKTDSPLLADLVNEAEIQYKDSEATRKHLLEKLGERFAYPDPKAQLERTGHALCTIVKSVEAEGVTEGYGNVIHLPDFGNIFLGELHISHFDASLTMLRVEMGCMAEGTLSASSARPNGSWVP